MKKALNYFMILFTVIAVFASCNEDEDLFPSEKIEGVYFINFGSYNKAGSSITKYNQENKELSNSYFKSQNTNISLSSNLQYAFEYQDSIFLIGNVSDQIVTVNPLFQQSQFGVSEKIENPRHAIGDGDYLYISCWGPVPDWNLMADSYIAKFNIKKNSVEKRIPLPGGPEGLEIVDNNLYVAISYIETPAVTSYFIKDNSNNLFVSLVSTSTIYSAEPGLGYINTSTNTLEKKYYLDGVSESYSSIISANSDFSKIYVLAAGWYQDENEEWYQKGAAHSFDVATGTFSTFIEDASSAIGIVADPITNDVYLLKNSSTAEGGVIEFYNENGTYKTEIACGISPTWALFLD
jgi:hypothetical protein